MEIMKSRSTRPVKIAIELMVVSRNKSFTVLFAAKASTCIGMLLFLPFQCFCFFETKQKKITNQKMLVKREFFLFFFTCIVFLTE